MTTHNTQEQDLRTALEGAERALRPFSDCVYKDNGDVSVSDIGRCGLPEFTAAYFAQRAALSALLAAPPRPVDAEGVEAWGVEDTGDAIWVGPMRPDGVKVDRVVYFKDDLGLHRPEYVAQVKADARLICESINAALASPAHSPDKAVTREGVEDACEAAWDAYRYGTPENRGPGWNDASPRSAWHAAWSACVAALAPKPTGTEAGRGVGAEFATLPVEDYRTLVAALEADDTFVTCEICGAWLTSEENSHGADINACWARAVEGGGKATCLSYRASPGWAPDKGWKPRVPADPAAVEALFQDFKEAYESEVATPTPPVSPSPNSTGPADTKDRIFPQGVGIGTYFRRLPDNSWVMLNDSSQWVTVPSPDSTGQGDAQTQECPWKILEAAEMAGHGAGPGDLALTILWPCGKETLEHVSDQAAFALGYAYPEDDTPTQQGPAPDAQTQEGGR